MDVRLVTSLGDHSRSAIAAARGQIRESMVSALTYSVHMHASPPRIRAALSVVNLRIDGVVETGGLQVIEIIAEGKNAAMTFLRGLCQRSRTSPGLNHCVGFQVRIQNFVPAHHGLPVFLQDLLERGD